MECLYPRKVWRSKTGIKENGRWPIVFRPQDGIPSSEMTIACGYCRSCRINKTRQWATRIMCEAEGHIKNCFITLTYKEECVGMSLVKKDFQNFIKKLRKKLTKEKIRIKYIYCGEYGKMKMRPHFHACIFGYDFPDREVLKKSGNRSILYRSAELETLWTYGYSSIGELTWRSAAYVASYIQKKIYGEMATEVYEDKIPEYANMSLRPAIGKEWAVKNMRDMYPRDVFVLKGGKIIRPPRYFDRVLEKVDKEEFKRVVERRTEKIKEKEKTSRDELDRIDRVGKIKDKKYKRSYEDYEQNDILIV